MIKVKLSSWVSIAEIISSLAVVVSLFYVMNEYQRSNSLTSRDVEDMLYSNIKEMERLIVENDNLANTLVLLRNGEAELNPVDQLQYEAFEHIFFDSWEYAWYYHKEGILNDENWNGWNIWFISELKNKPLLAWNGNRKNFSGKFLDYIDQIVVSEGRK